MPFKTGNKKKAGRVAGVPNKTTEQFRELIKSFVLKNWNNLQADFDKMKPGERALFRERLLKYFVPEAVNPDRLTEEQILQVIETLEKRQHETAFQNEN